MSILRIQRVGQRALIPALMREDPCSAGIPVIPAFDTGPRAIADDREVLVFVGPDHAPHRWLGTIRRVA